MDLPKFRGFVDDGGGADNMSITCGQFLDKIDRLCAGDDNDKIDITMSALAGPALEWAVALRSATGLLRWDDFKGEMMKKFQHKRTIKEKVELRRGLKQRPDELVRDFYSRCEVAQFLICDDVVRDIVFDREVLLNFLLGLRKPYQDVVIKSDADNMVGFLEAAIMAESDATSLKNHPDSDLLENLVVMDNDINDDEYLEELFLSTDDPSKVKLEVKNEPFEGCRNLDDASRGKEGEDDDEEEEEDGEGREGEEGEEEEEDEHVADVLNEAGDDGRDAFQCEECGLSFLNQKKLDKHVEVEHDPQSLKYKCDLCPAGFKGRPKYIAHVKAAHPEKCLFCRSCPWITFDKVKLWAHQAIRHEDRRDGMVVCPLCREAKKSQYSLEKHIRRVHMKERSFQCDMCSKTFFDKKTLDNHVRTIHLLEKPYECEQCHKRYGTKSGLYVHKSEYHPTGERLQCSKCPLTFGSSFYLNEHMSSHNEKTCVCEDCGAAFKRMNALRTHKINVHKQYEGINTLSCPYEGCTRVFTAPSYLTKHTSRVHEKNQGNLACTFCPKKFWAKERLKSHINGVHLGKKPHKCPHCDFTTAYRGKIREHVRANHTNIKYQCPVAFCNHQASYKSNLDKHIKGVHGKTAAELSQLKPIITGK